MVVATVSHLMAAGLVVIVKAVPAVTLASMVVALVAVVKASWSKGYYIHLTLY